MIIPQAHWSGRDRTKMDFGGEYNVCCTTFTSCMNCD